MVSYALALPGALAIGLSLGLLGSGGSILTVPVLVYLLGQEEKVAIASSLAIVGLIALIGSALQLQQKLINWRAVWLFGLPGMLGTYAGAWLSSFTSGAVQLMVFALVMLLSAWFMLRPDELTDQDARSRCARALPKIALDGLLVGALTGFVGVGGGFLIVPALTLLGGLSIRRAIATSLVIIALKAFAGFFKYTQILAEQNLSLDLNVIFAVTALGVIGSVGGNQIGSYLPQHRLQRGFGYFLILMGLFIFTTSAPAVFNV